jgi:hypothetical protein
LLIDTFTAFYQKFNDYYLITKLNILIIKDKLNLSFVSLYDDPKSAFIGIIFDKILKPLCKFISIESFRELFWYFSDGEIKLLHGQLILLMDEPFNQFCSNYQKLKQQITLIQPSPRSDTPNQAFERYENAYRIFLKSDDIPILFQSMAKLGTIFALSEMMDHAYLMKFTFKLQFSSCIHSYNSNFLKDQYRHSNIGEFLTLLEEEFQDMSALLQGVNPEPSKNHFLPSFTCISFQRFSTILKSCGINFNETSKDLLNIHSLKSFAAI